MALITPIIGVVILELVLNLANFGNDLSLFVTDKQDSSLQHLNDKVSLRYFIQEKNATKGKIESFTKVKPANTARIFVQGESTAVGFPYFFNGTFPRMLKYGIRQSDPTIQVELINLAMTALNSYALYDFVDEIIEQKPDAVIINAGHNEYYGALGVGSTSQFGLGVSMGRAGIWLRKTKIGQLLANTISAFTANKTKIDYHETLMKRMVKNHEIPLQSSIYKQGVKQFETNLRSTLKRYAEAGISVYLVNSVCNEKDQKPFISVDSDGEATKALKKASSDFNMNGNTTLYTSRLEKLTEQYPNYAMTFFLLGKTYFEQQNHNAAYYFRKAKELDALRFRSPEEINIVIEEISKEFPNVSFIDNDSVFRSQSPQQCIGKELILEHLHPNLNGHYLMAKTLFEKFATEENTLFPSLRQKSFPQISEMPLTEVDYMTGEISNLLLREGWPFLEPLPEEDGREKPIEEAIAGAISVKTMTWEKGMTQLLNVYLKTNEYEKALKICESLLLEYPHNEELYEKVIQLCTKTQAYEKGVTYGIMKWQMATNEKTARQLLVLYLKLDRPKDTLKYVQYLISIEAKPDFRPMSHVVNQLITAKDLLEKDPENSEVKLQIARLYNSIGNFNIAQRYESAK
tara:strand:+ start:52319 stop:54211 length:1893 start_codon:yes stop_codon:yes gene_type:complete